MSAFVKIKKSKNLRFKLISLMYLVFLMLSLIQIPTEWLSNNSFIYPYLNYSNTSNPVEYLNESNLRLQNMEPNMYNALGFDSTTNTIKEPNAYAPTDIYFIKNAAADTIFNILKDLNNWVNLKNTDTTIQKNYKELFADDLKNGLENDNLNAWKNWKWKHIPVTMALNLFEELKLRINLLPSNTKHVTLNEEPENNSNQIATNTDNSKLVLLSETGKLSIGETLKFHLFQDSIIDLKITKNNKAVQNSHTFTLDTVLFTPKETGKYTIQITGKKLHESFEVDVRPASIVPKNKSTLRIAYKGIKYSQDLPLNIQNLTLFVNGTNKGKIQSDKQLTYSPNEIGWNLLEVKSGNNILLSDSIYVKPLPEPYILVKDIPNFSISKKRFQQMNGIQLYAIHPSFDSKVFQIESFDITIPGTTIKSNHVNADIYSLPESFNNENLAYIIVTNITIKQGSETKTITEPIVVKIL